MVFFGGFSDGDIGSLREYIIAGTLYGVIFDDVFCFVSLGYKGGKFLWICVRLPECITFVFFWGVEVEVNMKSCRCLKFLRAEVR